MIKINLLPVRLARKKENAQRQLSVYVLSVLFLVLVMSYVAISFSDRAKSLSAELDETRTETTKYQKTVQEMDQQKKRKEFIQEKLALINQLQLTKSGPVHILDDISAKLPPRKLWLTTLRQDQKGMFLTGMALDNESIAQYMRNLSTSPYFVAIDLINSAQTIENEKKLMQFAINCQMKAPTTNSEGPGDKKE